MARTFKLTWQQGAAGRTGRWRKKYKGKAYYFPGGRGKSDREAYATALAAWEAKKHEIDGAVINSIQLDYEEAIEKWEDVLSWSRKHGDQSMAEEATDYLEKLRLRQESVRIKPLTHYDRFEGRFAFPRELLDQIISCIPSGPLSEEAKVGLVESLSRSMRSSGSFNLKGVSKESIANPLQTEKAIWEDRLKTQRRSALPSDTSVSHLMEAFVAEKDAEANAGELSAGRSYKVHLQLQDFAQWIGESTDVTEITSRLLIGYRQHLLERVSQGVWKRSTASGRMKTVRAFVRWLWRMEVIQSLPRVLDSQSKALAIQELRNKPVVFSNEELATLFRAAKPRMKLYMLLMLNCGMTQKDVSDLNVLEVDWEEGRIIRKRSKTRGNGNVPEVNYRLWPETWDLLQQESSGADEGPILLNRNGRTLCSEEYVGGKYKKRDGIKDAFNRLTAKAGILKSLTSLKKTSASLLRTSEKYNSVRSLFLGHAEPRLADQHYAKAPQLLLDEAMNWVREKLEIDKLDLTGGGVKNYE